MKLDINTTLAIIFGLVDVLLVVYQWKERSRIKAKEECWNKDAQSIVATASEMQKRIDEGVIKSPNELRDGIKAIGAFANGMHVGLKEELGLTDKNIKGS